GERVMSDKHHPFAGWPRARIASAIFIALLAASCSKEPTSTSAEAEQAAEAGPAAAAPAQAVSDAVSELSPEQLRTAALKAYQESRLYAPAGDNAMEYYLALRDKQPADAGVSSAL